MRQVRRVVVGLVQAGGALERGIDVTAIQHGLALRVRCLDQLCAIGFRIVFGVQPLVPLDRERCSASLRRPAIAGEDGDASQGIE